MDALQSHLMKLLMDAGRIALQSHLMKYRNLVHVPVKSVNRLPADIFTGQANHRVLIKSLEY